MSNYKEQLQNNNNELSAILETVEGLPKNNTMVVYNDSADYSIKVQGVLIGPNESQEVPIPSVTNSGTDNYSMFSYTLCCSALIASSGEYVIDSTWNNGDGNFTDTYIIYMTDMQFDEGYHELGFTIYPVSKNEISTVYIQVERRGDIEGEGGDGGGAGFILANPGIYDVFINGTSCAAGIGSNIPVSVENIYIGIIWGFYRSASFRIVNPSTESEFYIVTQSYDENTGNLFFSAMGEPMADELWIFEVNE